MAIESVIPSHPLLPPSPLFCSVGEDVKSGMWISSPWRCSFAWKTGELGIYYKNNLNMGESFRVSVDLKGAMFLSVFILSLIQVKYVNHQLFMFLFQLYNWWQSSETDLFFTYPERVFWDLRHRYRLQELKLGACKN